MTYRHGVLIHNFNEDHFGIDIQRIGRPAEPSKASISHLVHGWKQPVEQDFSPSGTDKDGIQSHILFGHAGDMRDPNVTLQQREHAPAHQYFMQDPGKLSKNLSADGFNFGPDPSHASKFHADNHGSCIAAKIKENWGDKRRSHALPANEMYMSESKRAAQQVWQQSAAEKAERRIVKPYGEFQGTYDAVKLTRSGYNGRGSATRSAAQLMMG